MEEYEDDDVIWAEWDDEESDGTGDKASEEVKNSVESSENGCWEQANIGWNAGGAVEEEDDDDDDWDLMMWRTKRSLKNESAVKHKGKDE